MVPPAGDGEATMAPPKTVAPATASGHVSASVGGGSASEPLPPPSQFRQLRAKGRVRGGMALLGPAFVAAVAYIDPGNFATNLTAGARLGYLLVWVIVAANLMAMLVP